MKHAAALLLLAACGGDDTTATDARPLDAVISDGPPAPDAPTGCAAGETPPLAMIAGTEGLAIADDGTMYFSQAGHLGRWIPGAASPESTWVTLTGTTTVWGVAIDAAGLVYVASPPHAARNGTIWRVDPASPTPEELYVSPGTTDRPNGLTIGPDGGAYYSDFGGGGVYRVDSSGARTTVTTSAIPQANGVLFDDDGTLLVLAYGSGDVERLTLDGNHQETGRVLAGSVAGNPDGIARDDQGRYYVTDNSGGEVLRYDSAFANPTSLLTNTNAAANMAFGRGALGCHDLYVTSSGTLKRLDAGATGSP
jgi:sugar lactone lactonase YvrE